MNRYRLRLSALAIGVAMVVGTYSLVVDLRQASLLYNVQTHPEE
jgi:hypothetical protein